MIQAVYQVPYRSNNASYNSKQQEIMKWELHHVTKNKHLITFTAIYYDLLGGHLCMGAPISLFI